MSPLARVRYGSLATKGASRDMRLLKIEEHQWCLLSSRSKFSLTSAVK